MEKFTRGRLSQWTGAVKYLFCLSQLTWPVPSKPCNRIPANDYAGWG